MNKEKKWQASLHKGFKDRWVAVLVLKNKLVDSIKEAFSNYSFDKLETFFFQAEDGIRD